jgi:hypothetical protein
LVCSRGGQQIDADLNRLIGLVISGFEFAVGAVRRIGWMVEAAVGQRSTEALVEEKELECDAFCGELVGVVGAVALQ